ncbi:UDP-D-xylose:L-fucose alpha-1,3-D-xylosyltransferase mgp4 [Turnera subulata]|uniref:UDP-D-xylose:L-fucose alpha-1,3-D-xylosyltransferase mgp4 n=1 Tax=Turnera subulata TaxID=218843 RepID=A0A9Q0F310_9ROSI|nr:UDP-D-xylose:L-fucose alpha-1,3-D-xylosyltransferase mgp4 [Turnera subulata]
MSQSLQQRPLHNPRSSSNSHRHIPIFNRTGLLSLLSLLLILGVVFLWARTSFSRSSSSSSLSKWRHYTLSEAASFVAKDGTVIVCSVSHPWLPFLNNWLISVSRQRHQEKVLVIAEDYATLFEVNERWPGHAVLVPPAPDSQAAHDFGSQGFFNITSRRAWHLLQILELGYNVMLSDVDMVWLGDPFAYLEGSHDVYFMDDIPAIKPLNHSHDLPHPTRYMGGLTSKLVMKKWIEEIEAQPWFKTAQINDQTAFNWALMKTAGQVDVYLLPQAAFPTGGLYFENKTWVEETKGKHVIIHNNWIVGFERKIKRFRDYGLWLVDDHDNESPLGKL